MGYKYTKCIKVIIFIPFQYKSVMMDKPKKEVLVCSHCRRTLEQLNIEEKGRPLCKTTKHSITIKGADIHYTDSERSLEYDYELV